MTQEEKQLLLKDLCARLPYGVKAQHTFSDGSIEIGELEFIVKEEAHLSWGAADIDDNFKPYLRPMASMADEEKDEYDRLVMCNASWNVDDWLNSHHFDYRGLIEKGLALKALEGMYD